MYVAYYGRPGDSAGIAYWSGELQAAGGDMTAIIDVFGTSQEYVDRYGSLTHTEMVDAIYQQIFSRLPDTAGRDYYVGLLDNGDLTSAQLAYEVLNGATGSDLSAAENKLDVANDFTQYVDLVSVVYDATLINDAVSILSTVDATPATVSTGIDSSHSYLNGLSTVGLPGDLSGVTALSPGDAISSDLSVDGERDIFSITLEQWQSYSIDLSNALFDQATLRVFDPSGDAVAFSIGVNASSVRFNAAVSGTYHIVVSDLDGNSTGTYDLSTAVYAGDDYVANSSTAGSIVIEGGASEGVADGEIERVGDVDWISFTPAQWSTYNVEIYGHDLDDPNLQLVDAAGSVLASGSNGLLTDYTSNTADTLYIQVRDNAGSQPVGDYQVVVTLDQSDDFSADVVTTGSVALGNFANGELESVGDVDWFAVSMTQGQSYDLLVSSLELDGAEIELFDRSGGLINSPGTSGLAYTATSTGTHYVGVNAGSSSVPVGLYTLSFQNATISDDFSDNTGTSGKVVLGNFTNGEIEIAGDIDWFAVSVVQWETYDFQVSSLDLNAPEIRLYDETGALLLDPAASNLTHLATNSGTYYVGVDAGSSTATTGLYTVSFQNSSVADDYDATTATSGTVSLGGSSTGRLEQVSDADWFAVSISTAGSYDFNVSSSDLDAPVIKLYDSTGTILNNNTSASIADYSITQSGTYYLEILDGGGAVPVGDYTVAASLDAIADDYAADTTTTGNVAVGSSITGRLETEGDNDWFQITLAQWDTYDIQATSAALDDLEISLFDASGALLTDFSSSSGSYTAVTPGAHYVQVNGGTGSTSVGDYILSIGLGDTTDDYANDTSTTGSISLGGSMSGRLEVVADVDWYAVTLTQWETYDFAITSSDLDAPVLTLYDAAGTLINSPGAQSLSYTAEATGTFYIGVDAGAGSIPVGDYAISFSAGAADDDFTSDTSTAGMITVGGTAAGRLERVGDADWFAAVLSQWESYDIALSSPTLDAGRINVYDATGTLIHTGVAATETFIANASGTFYFEVVDGGGSTPVGDYDLALGAVDATDDYAGSTATSGVVLVGDTAAGRIETVGDTDWLAVDLDQGTTYYLTVNSSYLDKVGLRLLDGSALELGADLNGDADGNALVGYTPDLTGTYYLEIFDASGDFPVGPYTVAAALSGTTDDAGSAPGTAVNLAIDGSVNGQIEIAGDRDWYGVTLEQWNTYALRVESAELDMLGLRLFDSSGNTVIDSDIQEAGETEALIQISALVTDGFYIEVYDAGGTVVTGEYTLEAVLDMADDYVNSLSTDARIDVGGSITARLNMVGDHDLFAVDFQGGRSYHLEVSSSDLDAPAFRVLNSRGEILVSDELVSGESVAELDFAASRDDTYFVQIYSLNGTIPVGEYTAAVDIL
ncbi:hypothetical protein OLMES_3490 [Oleiphilus messinensis]|uniref:Uncharacterized protein n=2 Tax=Oleiphilus messinensis TaxID=141451 RepID=A0A1Y0IDG5_9GAMM|nr:hypothetical protein OLMES_3490 [Oleiphilus messinensis]